MKTTFIAILFSVFLASCGSNIKKSHQALNSGDYNKSINISIAKLQKSKFNKRNQHFVLILEDAFGKITQKNLDRIDYLKQEGNPDKLEEIYKLYENLDNIQNKIRPLLPLSVLKEDRNAAFEFLDYSDVMLDSKLALVDYLYNKTTVALAGSASKLQFRQIFNDLAYLDKIYSGYKNVAQLIDEAHFRGTEFIEVQMVNDSDKVIPKRLSDDLLNFDGMGINDFWTEYHTTPLEDIEYDSELLISLREINISPEQISEREVVEKRDVKDGWEYKKDKNGKVQEDEEGNKIKVDVFKKVKCVLNSVLQTKSTQVVGQIQLKNKFTQQAVKTLPISSEFLFENQYASFLGDRRALTEEQRFLTENVFIPFPTNEQMIFDSGENLKLKLKEVIKQLKK
jgi:hypothetical protein